ncbi:aldo/keto reductase [Paralimibaculum aggregatum]|uniref:Aldo/keto reductase n=1 Tax=Paralimibaculum aggregatum TaxID=3036245 RepID=A0ABQ6LTV6_9RHOB|nr:aldo/keto reductase [Limibaculum sp. NKW23]GMG85519.1 aldo/keto reductase [Limibaculum sp. NKW23]
MKTVRLGRTGLRVSALCYGTMSFGGDADEAEAGRLYAACRDAGIDCFDCANLYNGGRAEEILGRLAAHERSAVTIISKAGYGQEGDPGGRCGRRDILAGVEQSLRRLGTDRLDILFLHRFDAETRLEETLRALEDLVSSGKVLHLGASNYAAWQVMKALGLQAREGWARFDAVQPMYNLVKRQAEVEILPMAAAEGLGVISYSPLGGGLLTGKYLEGATGRLTTNARYGKRYGPDWMHAAAEGLTALARARDVSPVTLAVAWVAAHPAITAPIVGARSVEQLRPALAAADLEMNAELYAEIAALSPAPPPATDRLEEAG